MTELKTRRLHLRLPRADDAEPIARSLNNLAVSGNLARVPYPYRLSDARAWLRTRRDDLPPEETNFAIEIGDAGLVGQIGFHRREGMLPVIGYWLAEEWWGHGIMTEAAEAAIDWFFGATRHGQIESGVFVFNPASLRIQHKLGFVETGRSQVLCLARDREVEHIDTRLTRADWTQRRK